MRAPRSRKEMIAYLSDHFCYDTMNSWNAATSYAANVKIHKIDFPDKETQSRAYDLVSTDEANQISRQILDDFAEEHSYCYQAGFNGRSRGYIVLYQGGRKQSEYKSCCSACGQRNFQEATETSKQCGRCRLNTRYNVTMMETFAYPGRGMDMDRDYEDWDTDTLRSRVKLVMSFDKMVERCIAAFIDFCQTHEPEEETYYVPQTRTVAKHL